MAEKVVPFMHVSFLLFKHWLLCRLAIPASLGYLSLSGAYGPHVGDRITESPSFHSMQHGGRVSKQGAESRRQHTLALA
jgi:hypothetical protein